MQNKFVINREKLSIQNDRLILREWTREDLLDLYELMSQEEVMNPIGSKILNSTVEADKVIDSILSWYEKMSKYELAIYSKRDSRVIGTIGIKLRNVSNNIVEIGYLLNKYYWKKGIMTECMAMIIDYIRSINSDIRIICECSINNPASRRVVEKSGMKFINYIERDNNVYEVYEI